MKYKNPPIKEAIFDIRIDSLGKPLLDEIEKIHLLILKDFPNKKKQINVTGKFELKEGTPVRNETGSAVRGFIFSSVNNCLQVQFQLDGFTLNMLKPYSEWDEFSTEAFRLWKIYQDNFEPNAISRIALRYINRIEIPFPFGDFQEYISNMPPIPACLPQTFQNFFMQIQVPCDTVGTGIVLTETIEPLVKNFLPFILDIDAYKTDNISKDIETLKANFDSLRDLKNQVFEKCITEKTQKLFD